jgi:hypothetical protein
MTNKTNGFDIALEVSEQTYRDVIGSLLDTGSFLGQIVGNVMDFVWKKDQKGLPNPRLDINIPFTIEFSLGERDDKPHQSDIPLTGDMIDLTVKFGEPGGFQLGSFRIVAGLRLQQLSDSWQCVILDLANMLWHTEIQLIGVTDPYLNNYLKTLLTRSVGLGYIPLLPIPVTPAYRAEATEIKGTAIKVIDDKSGADRDAFALALSFGGNTTANSSNVSAFTQSFVPAGTSASMAISFDWIYRLLESALGLPRGFINGGKLVTPIFLAGGFKFDVTVSSPVHNCIEVTVVISKKTSTFTASYLQDINLRWSMVNGAMNFTVDFNQPDIEVNFELWVTALAYATGAAFFLDVVDGLAKDAMNEIINEVSRKISAGITQLMDKIKKAVQKVYPASFMQGGLVNVPLVNTKIGLSDLDITGSDITIGCKIIPQDNVPICSENTFSITDGFYVDLETGSLFQYEALTADLHWVGDMKTGKLNTVGNTAIAVSNAKSFDDLYHYRLYELNYQINQSIPVSQLSQGAIYVVRTREGRHSIIQMTQITGQIARIRYRTYSSRSIFSGLDSMLGYLTMLL